MFSERSSGDPFIPWRSFRDSFKERRVKKIMCTAVGGADPKEIGFSDLDQLDTQRISFFLNACSMGEPENIRFAINTKFDHRFMAKFAIGLSFSLFGRSALTGAYADELYKTLGSRKDDEPSDIRGSTPLSSQSNPAFLGLTGESHAVTVFIIPTPDGIAVNLNIDKALNWTVKCTELTAINANLIEQLGMGRVIVLYRQLQKGVELPLQDYIAHKTGAQPNPRLAEATASLNKHTTYLENLP